MSLQGIGQYCKFAEVFTCVTCHTPPSRRPIGLHFHSDLSDFIGLYQLVHAVLTIIVFVAAIGTQALTSIKNYQISKKAKKDECKKMMTMMILDSVANEANSAE